MTTYGWIAVALFGAGFLALAALVAFGRLEDRPYDYDDPDEFFAELLEDTDVQEMQAKRKGREGR